MKRYVCFLSSLFLLACAPAANKAPVAPTPAPAPSGSFHGGRSSSLPAGRIVDAKTGAEIPFEEMINELAHADEVYVGEIHDQRVQHEAQLWILKGLFYARPGTIAVGMEMFQRPFQGVLDLYLSGEIGEKALLRETEYETRWGYDFGFYRPILRFALDHGVPILALNAPTEWVKKISSVGLEGLSPQERDALPEMDLNDPEHRRMVEEAFSRHPHGGSIEKFYAIQTLWDETMADTIARFIKPLQGKVQVVVFAGRAHVEGGLGIPKRVVRRVPGTYKIVIPISVPRGSKVDLQALLKENLGDYLWLLEVEEEQAPEKRS